MPLGRAKSHMKFAETTSARMFQEVSKSLGSVGCNLLINGVLLGAITHPLILTSWDIQAVVLVFSHLFF